MPYAVLEKELETLPAEAVDQVVDFVRFIKWKFSGGNTIDFDERLDDFGDLKIPAEKQAFLNEVGNLSFDAKTVDASR